MMTLEKFININWYMERKPYTPHTDYDVFYLKICRQLYTIIYALAIKHEDDLDMDEEDCREMAYILTAYFEDQVNEIGFWKSLILLHKKQFGKRLPFFSAALLQQQEEEWEDILPADIHYLAFMSYVTILRRLQDSITLVKFYKPFFEELTENVSAYLGQIHEVSISAFYKDFLVPAADYTDFKKQLNWFTLNGYLTGIEFSAKRENLLLQLVTDQTEESIIMPLMYGETDRLLFEEPSSLTAFFPVDIFAGALQCSNEKKEEIRNLKLRPHGIFHVQQGTKDHYLFLHTSTGEEFNVNKNSFDKKPDITRNEYWISTIAKWNNEYNISGLCLPSPYLGDEIYHRNIRMQHSFQKHFLSYRKHIEQTALNYRTEAYNFFGADLIIFESGEKLQEKLTGFDQWYLDNITDKTKLVGSYKPAQTKLPQEILMQKDVALFIPPADGFQFLMYHKQLLQLLQTSEIDKILPKQIQELLPMLFEDAVGIEYWQYLKNHFPLPNLSLFVKCPADEKVDFEAMLRIYRPKEFSPLKLPRFTTFTSERISADTVKNIFNKNNT
jgi:hypothetical protein